MKAPCGSLGLVFLLFLFAPARHATAQLDRISLSLGVGRINASESFSDIRLYREASLGVRIRSLDDDRLPGTISVYAGYWGNDEHVVVLCQFACPDYFRSVSSTLVGMRALQTVFEGPFRASVGAGFSNVYEVRRKDSRVNERAVGHLMDASADIDVPVWKRIGMTLSISRYFPIASEEYRSTGHLAIRGALTVGRFN